MKTLLITVRYCTSCLALLTFCALHTSAQSFDLATAPAYRAREIHFVGYDFRFFEMLDSPTEENKSMRSVVSNWYNYMKSKVAIKTFERYSNQKVKVHYEVTRCYLDSISFNDMVTRVKSFYPPADLDDVVRDYKMEETSGVGLVIIPEFFEKESESCQILIAFFDIASRKVFRYDTYESHSQTKGIGMKNHWGAGFKHTVELYFKRVYLPEKRNREKGKM